jgi:hypothetical protein
MAVVVDVCGESGGGGGDGDGLRERGTGSGGVAAYAEKGCRSGKQEQRSSGQQVKGQVSAGG